MAHAADQIVAQSAGQSAGKGVPAARTRQRMDFDFAADREVAFRRARRHTWLVRTLRLVLPVTAVALFASYGLFVQRSVKISKGKGSFSFDSASIIWPSIVFSRIGPFWPKSCSAVLAWTSKRPPCLSNPSYFGL